MSVGEDLAAARQRAGLTVADVSRRTRIKAAIIDSIERGDYAACGADFYVRGHIRAIATAVGADPGPLIADFDATRAGPGAMTAGQRPGRPGLRPRQRLSPATLPRRRLSRATLPRRRLRRATLPRRRLSRATLPRRRLSRATLPRRRHALGPIILVVTGALVLTGLVVAALAGFGAAGAPNRPGVAWSFSAASNTVTVRLTMPRGSSARRVLTRSRLVVSEEGRRSRSASGRMVVLPVPAGRRTRLVVRVEGPQPSSRTLTVTAPPALRVIGSRRDHQALIVSVSDPLRSLPRRRLCGRDQVSLPASREVAVASGPDACRARLRLTDRDGERAAVPVVIPALPKVPLYSFASPAHRAIYITVDDGWTPSRQVLAIMRRTHLPVTAFLIEQAARRDLPYWRAFVKAGGTVGDHTVSHPVMTRLTLGQATTQWEQARRTLGRWLGQVPVLGRPPYGAFDPAVEAAAYRAGLKKLVGWSVVVDSDGIQTWNHEGLQAGEIVLLHWVPGLGSQLAGLLHVIRARHLNPTPLTQASFAGITPQRRSLGGD